MNLIEDWMTRLAVASVFGALLSCLLAVAFRFRRPAPQLECWAWRLCCLKLLLMALLPIAICLPFLPQALSHDVDIRPVASTHESVQTSGDDGIVSQPTAKFRSEPLLDEVANLHRSDRPSPAAFSNTDLRYEHQVIQQPNQTAQSSLWPRLMVVAFVLWTCGVVAQLLRLAVQWNRARSLLATFKPIRHADLIQFTYQQSRQLGLPRPPRLMIGALGCSPRLIGMRQPCILLSRRFFSDCSMDEVKLIIVHELAHVARRDLFWNWLIATTSALFFFHPSVWWMSRRIQATQEMACDHMVLSRLRACVGEYARLLLKIMMMQQVSRLDRVAEVGASGRVGTLEERLLSMKRTSVKHHTVKQVTWITTAVAVVLLLPWKLVAFSMPTSSTQPRSASETSEGQNHIVSRTLVSEKAVTSTSAQSENTEQESSALTRSSQDDQRTGRQTSRSTRTGGTTASSSSSSASSASSRNKSAGGSTGSISTNSSEISKSVTYSADGESVSIKQRGNRFTVERKFSKDGEPKSEMFQFKSLDEFREKLPNEFKRFQRMTSPTTGARGAGAVEVREDVRGGVNPAQQMLLENLNKMREENAENPQMQQMIDQMIKELTSKTKVESAK